LHVWRDILTSLGNFRANCYSNVIANNWKSLKCLLKTLLRRW